MYRQNFGSYQNETFKTLQTFCKEKFNIDLVFNLFKIQNCFSHKYPIPNNLKSHLVYKLLLLAVVLKGFSV